MKKITILLMCLFILNVASAETLYCVVENGEAHDANTWYPAKIPDGNDKCIIEMLNGAKWISPLIIGTLEVNGINCPGSASTSMRVAPEMLGDCILNEGIITTLYTDLSIGGNLNLIGFSTFINQITKLRVAGVIEGDGLIDNHSAGKIFCDGIFADVYNGPGGGFIGGVIYPYNYIEGNLDLRGKVDFKDLAIFANNWLKQ